jgi:hypothetical protein
VHADLRWLGKVASVGWAHTIGKGVVIVPVRIIWLEAGSLESSPTWQKPDQAAMGSKSMI